MQGLRTEARGSLQVPRVLENISFIIFNSKMRQIYSSCTLSRMLLQRIRFGAHRYRLAFHRATNYTFHSMHSGISIPTNHLGPGMLHCPMILTLSAHLIRSSLLSLTYGLGVIGHVDDLHSIEDLDPN
jgi:hypothetical protein